MLSRCALEYGKVWSQVDVSVDSAIGAGVDSPVDGCIDSPLDGV